jgi:peptidoglycan/LPS O-acetylase OafA/YrhL
MQPQAKRLTQLVSIRGLAAWLVVFYHSLAFLKIVAPNTPQSVFAFIAHGHMAVDFFFVLSGFIIYINYHDRCGSDFKRSAWKFYWNRFTRIYPLHALMLIAYLLLAGSFLYFSASHSLPAAYSANTFWANVFLVQAWKDNTTSWNVPAWSISAEWFIYLWFPAIALVLGRFFRSVFTNLILVVAILTAVCMLGFNQIALFNLDVVGLPLVRVTHEFLLGAIAGSLFVNHHVGLVRYQRYMLLTGVLVAALSLLIDLPVFLTLPLLCFLFVTWLSVDSSPLSDLLSNRFLVYVGEISYSTYLVHYFVNDVFKAVFIRNVQNINSVSLLTSFAVVLLLSMLLHRTVEVPAQRVLRSRFFKKVPSLITS